MTIRAVTIAGVRGIRSTLSLALDGRSLLVRGDNGTGKSSIVQGLRWALTGSPVGRSSESLPDEYVRHRLCRDGEDARVTIELSDGGTIDLNGGQATCHGSGGAFRQACVLANPFLRRDEIRGVLDDAPGARFKYLERFLDLDRVDAVCSALGGAVKRRTADVKQLQREVDEALEAASARLPSDAPPPCSAQEVTAAFAALARTHGVEVADAAGWNEIASSCAVHDARVRSAEVARRRDSLVALVRRAEALVLPALPSAVLASLREAHERAQEPALAALLHEALHVVERHGASETCPVCEQSVSLDDLQARLRERVAVLAEVRSQEAQAAHLAEAWGAFLDGLGELERQAGCSASEIRRTLAGRALLEDLDRSARSLANTIAERVARVREVASTELAALPRVEDAVEIRRIHEAVVATGDTLGRLEQAEAALRDAKRRADELGAVEKALSAARKDEASRILGEIGSLVERYYSSIHPPGEADEATGAPRIVVQRHGSGTALIRGMFNKEEVGDPRHVYSDGHLDTVGICIFLALRRFRADRDGKKDPKLMILDDIVTSIDANHARRLVELLRDDFSDHQIVILSHNEYFVRLCRGPLHNARHLCINQWTLEDGPRLVGYVSHADGLRAALESAATAEAVASAMRPVLDELLHHAACAFRVNVPAGGELTVADYWGPVRKKLREHSKRGVLPGLEAIFARIGEPGFLRNALGAHFNEWALDVGHGEVARVARDLLELVDHLECATCKSIVRPKVAHDPSLGLTCDCGRGSAPNLPSTRGAEPLGQQP
jgi:hypothetical protein